VLAIQELIRPKATTDNSPHRLNTGEANTSSVEIYVLRDGKGKVNNEIISHVCEHLLNNELVIGDFSSTYGIMFLDGAREKVKEAKGEKQNKPVSVAARLSDSLNWIDWQQVHSYFRDHERVATLGQKLTDVGFLRFPVNGEGARISKYSIDSGQMQVIPKPENDPILTLLLNRYGIKAYLLTSLNPHGQLERYQPDLAFSFTKEIKARAFVLNTNDFRGALDGEPYIDTRRKKGSVPIIQLPRINDVNPYTKTPIITIVRSANTHPYSIERAIKEVFPHVALRYIPEKPEPPQRPQFSLPHEARKHLFKILYEASFPER